MSPFLYYRHVLNSFLIIIVSVGKYFLKILSVDLPNDLYVHVLGCYIIGGSVFGVYTVVSQIRQRIFKDSLSIFVKWFIWVRKGSFIIVNKLCKFTFLSFIWFGIIPLLVGFAFELVCIFPLYYNMEKTAPIIWNEIWVFGLFFLGSWSRVVSMIPLEEFSKMKEEFEILKRNGIYNFDATRTLKNITFPIIYELVLFLLIPYIICYGVIGNVWDLTDYDLSYAYTFSYPLLFCLNFTIFVFKKCISWVQKLHKLVKDDQFLVQRRIVNLE